jgi:hypothetical protein
VAGGTGDGGFLLGRGFGFAFGTGLALGGFGFARGIGVARGAFGGFGLDFFGGIGARA